MSRTIQLVLGDLIFEWDSQKARANRKKHGLSFEDGASVFRDVNAILLDDPDVFDDEERFELLGYSVKLEMAVVVHVVRETRFRLLSVRPATRNERSLYEESGKG